jgi:hypothetical protein
VLRSTNASIRRIFAMCNNWCCEMRDERGSKLSSQQMPAWSYLLYARSVSLKSDSAITAPFPALEEQHVINRTKSYNITSYTQLLKSK